MADQAAIALENARLFEERERRIRELTALNYISERINATLALDELLVELHQGIGTFLDISNSFIALHDIKTNHLTFPIHWNRGSSQPINGSMIVEDVNCLSQRIVIEQRPILLRTYEEVNALSSEKPEEGPEQTSSWLGVPIMQGDDVLGIINVQSYHSFAYDEDDQRFLMTVASQVATALANARLFAERERRLSEVSVMRDISSAITSTLDLNDMLERLIVELGRVIDVSTSLVVLYDKDEQFLHYPIVYDRGAPMHIPSLPITRGGINRWVITHRQSLLLHTNEEAEQYRKSVDSRERVGSGTYVEESFLVVPIVSGDETLGVINIQSYETSKFSEDDLRFVSTVANQAAIAINNAHVFQERGRRIEELATFNEIGQQLSVVSDLDQLFNLIYTQTSRLLDTTNFYIALYDERHGEFTYPLYYGSSQRSRVNGKNIEDNFNSAVVETRIPVLRKGNDIRKLLRSRGIHTTRKLPKSWLAVPMVATDHVLGVIAIRDYEREQAYTQDDLRLLSTIASWGAIAFENARLLGETRQSFKEIEVLYAMSVSLSSTLDSTEVQHIIASSAIEILSGEICVLFLFDEQQKVSQHTILDNQTLEMTVETPEADHILAKLLLEADRPVALNDVNQLESPLQDLLALGIQSAIGTLIGPRESPIGAAWVGSRQQRDWQEREQSLMLIFASQSGQAMESARLFHEVRTLATELEQRVKDRTAALAELNEQLTDEKERLQAIHAITLELTASLDLNETLTKTLGLASRTVNVQRGSVMLLDQESKQLICHAVLDKENVVRPVYTTVTFMEGQSLVDWVVEKKKPVRIADVQQDERWVKEEGRADEVRSVVAIPLVAREEPLGVLLLTSPKVNYFTEAQLQLLWTIANESAIAINNAILFSFISEMGERRATLLHQQSEETSKNQAILQSLGEGVIVLDEDQKVILFNPAAQEMLDIPAFSVLHQPLNSISTLGHNLETRQRADIIHAGLQDGLDILSNRDQNINRTLELPSPTQTLDLNFAPVFSTEHTKFGSVVVLRDVTREIEADRAKQNFISSVSHELRTPLTSIKGYVDLLLLGAGGPIVEAQLPYLNVVKNNTKRLMDLINDILEIGRIDADKIELNLDEVDIPSIVHDVLQTMHAELERKSITASIDLQDNLPLITADPRRLTQVIMNLVSNAIKYTYPEGAIMVRTVLNPAGMVQMDVEDNGVGISEEDQKHLFRRFYRADNPLRDEAGGTGLGLVIAKSYIERHSGEMWVSSKLGQGSAFSFIIPVKQAEPKESIEPTTDS
ncbi:MAG: GAF domain-containing protein [Chloroflexota bacterium]